MLPVLFMAFKRSVDSVDDMSDGRMNLTVVLDFFCRIDEKDIDSV